MTPTEKGKKKPNRRKSTPAAKKKKPAAKTSDAAAKKSSKPATKKAAVRKTASRPAAKKTPAKKTTPNPVAAKTVTKPKPVWEPQIIVFASNWCSYAGADTAGVSRIQHQPNFRMIRVMCSGRIQPAFVFRSFEEPAQSLSDVQNEYRNPCPTRESLSHPTAHHQAYVYFLKALSEHPSSNGLRQFFRRDLVEGHLCHRHHYRSNKGQDQAQQSWNEDHAVRCL